MDDDGREQEMAVGRLERGKKKLQRVMNKSVRRWMIVIYKQALVLIRQAFKMVQKLARPTDGKKISFAFRRSAAAAGRRPQRKRKEGSFVFFRGRRGGRHVVFFFSSSVSPSVIVLSSV